MSGTSTYATLLLDVVTWDLVVDAAGNIEVAQQPYALAQDAASAIRLFQGELWYNVSPGVPYFTQILGKFPSINAFKAALVSAALTVPGVVQAVCYVTGFTDRVATGQVQVTDTSGTITAASF